MLSAQYARTPKLQYHGTGSTEALLSENSESSGSPQSFCVGNGGLCAEDGRLCVSVDVSSHDFHSQGLSIGYWQLLLLAGLLAVATASGFFLCVHSGGRLVTNY